MGSDDERDQRLRRVAVLGIRCDVTTTAGAREWLRDALREPWDGRCRHIVTLNPEYVMAARRDAAFAQAIETADLVTADGAGVVLGARLAHGARIDRVTGVDLVEWLAEESAVQRAPLFFLGASEGIADAAMRRLSSRFPGLRSAGTWSAGTPDPACDAPALDRISAGNAKSVAVAYGAPGQVFWIDRNRERLSKGGVRIAIGVGGSLDYLAGTARRPPGIVRRFGLEWLYRLAREPWRWRRQLVLPRFAARMMIAAAGSRIGAVRERR